MLYIATKIKLYFTKLVKDNFKKYTSLYSNNIVPYHHKQAEQGITTIKQLKEIIPKE